MMQSGLSGAQGLEREGIHSDRVKWNLSTAVLYEEAVRREEGTIAADGPLTCRTGQHTGRSLNDKFVASRRARPTSPGARSTGRWTAIRNRTKYYR